MCEGPDGVLQAVNVKPGTPKAPPPPNTAQLYARLDNRLHNIRQLIHRDPELTIAENAEAFADHIRDYLKDVAELHKQEPAEAAAYLDAVRSTVNQLEDTDESDEIQDALDVFDHTMAGDTEYASYLADQLIYDVDPRDPLGSIIDEMHSDMSISLWIEFNWNPEDEGGASEMAMPEGIAMLESIAVYTRHLSKEMIEETIELEAAVEEIH